MSAAFEPADGKQARWRYLYDMVVERKPGDDITVDEVCELLDIDAHTARGAMRDAKRHLELDKRQTVRTVERFGWIVIDARGNLDEIEKRRKKSYRAADRGVRLAVATEAQRDRLSQIERSRLDFEKRHLLAAQGLHSRRTKSFAELEREAKKKSTPELPFRKEEGA